MKKKKQYIIAIIILVMALGFGTTLGALTWIIKDTPDITNYSGSKETSLIYSAEGDLLTKFYIENRIFVPLDRIPEKLKKAIVAIEDTKFYAHHGIDLWGIPRAVLVNIKQRRFAQGFSTITMQLAENAIFEKQQRTIYRKIQEIYLALQFEHLYTKPQILEMYLNEIFLGHSVYGVQSAAQFYFGKNVWELNLSESALIAGLPKAPNGYSPFNNYESAINRRNVVLKRMKETGHITDKEFETAKNQELELRKNEVNSDQIAPYFMTFVRKQLKEKLEELFGDQGPQMINSGGLKVYTTLDLKMQEKAEDTVKNAINNFIPSLEKVNSDLLQPQLALISLDPKTGAIRSMIGGRGNDKFNRVTQAKRQPGSAFKPFVYTTAMKQGYSPGSVINDMPVVIGKGNNTYVPQNFQYQYRGLVTLRTGLIHSINIAAVKLLDKVGIKNTINTAEEMGITTFTPEDGRETHYSLALGGLYNGVTPLEMASAYGIFANEGVRVEPYVIRKILDKNGNTIYEAHPQKQIVLEKDISYLMTDMLQDVVKKGTGRSANLDRPVAGKTGTTNDHTNAWFVGFTPDLVTSVWIGEDNSSSMHYNQKDEDGNYLYPESSSHGYRIISSGEAAQLWGDYMKKVVTDMPKSDFIKPNNIVEEKIDPITGLLPNKYTPDVITEIFRDYNLPLKKDDIHGEIDTAHICKDSQLLATSSCPETIEYDYILDNNIIINTDNKVRIDFSERNNGEFNTGKNIRGTYIVEPGEPFQKIDKKIGLPLTTINGKLEYSKIPEKICDQHGDSTTGDNLLDNIWDFFKSKPE